MKIIKMLTLADLVTLSSAASALLAMLLAISDRLMPASFLIVLSVFLDWADGRVARATKKVHPLGKELDSLADLVAFCVAPAVFGFLLVGWHPIITAVIIFFLLCGVLRLARFNVTDHKKGFQGVPTTVNGVLFPVLYWLSLPTGFYVYVYFFMGVLMISSIQIKKIV